MSKLKVAVIGCGSIAKHRHIPEYAADYKELLAAEKPDAVSICLPNALHAPVSLPLPWQRPTCFAKSRWRLPRRTPKP